MTNQEVTCKNCNNTFVIEDGTPLEAFGQTRQVEGLPGVVEVGLVCPGCATWYHVGYTNQDLERQRHEASLPNRRSFRGKYARRYAFFQQEVQRRLRAAEAAKRG